ncbi:SLC13 family permease [Rahnella sp. SAP-1]|uniref:SLC13 family permease n=1 Tax=Rouxiella aceris TaxID=2703884 RepID=A0A848MHS5_9GAMM|nr:SLC13 family permease [Rouxiella aceris]NMP27245.1 SLC13 family permease [Rouxiella aceris]
MNAQLMWVLILLAAAVYLFASNKIRMDVVALLVIVAFVFSGTLTVTEALAGFSDANVILIAALFVVGHGLVRTGVAYQVGEWLMRAAGNSETRMLVLLMLAVAGLGAFMSSTGVVAIFIPVVISVADRMQTSVTRLMMPLSFAGLISGMMTLVATPPNMVVNSELLRAGFAGFGFFGVTPIGLVVLVSGIGYMLVARRWLANEPNQRKENWRRRTFLDLIRDYQLSGRARRMAIRPGSPLVGQTLDGLHLRARYGANVIGIERWRKFRRVMISVTSNTELKARDVLLIDMSAAEMTVRQFCAEQQLEPLVLRGEYFSGQSRDVGMAEVSLIPDSELPGKTLRQVMFRSQYGLNVVGIRRQGQAIAGKLVDEELMIGDMLLVAGDWKLIRQLQQKTYDFIVLNLPAEVDDVAPAVSQAPHALFCLALMVALMLTDGIPNVLAALIACLLMGKFRCFTAESAYKSIHWPSLILIVGMMPFALALQRTGGVELVVRGLMDISGGQGPRVMLLSLFVLCAVIGLFISNTATAVLMAPIAIAAAHEMGLSPYPFIMAVALAASAAFMTPVSSPVNTLVMVPGNYRFADFLRIGVPFTLWVMLVSVVLVPLIYPF